ncbi:MAG: ester cyclase [Anaerolineales bacterium]|nr:ester cyclase [Anaerolineales bacterium]
MSIDANRTIIRRYREIHNTNQLDKLGEVLATDFVPHSLMPGLPAGLDGARMAHQGAVASFPDVHTISEDLIAEGDKVVERWSMTMTHTGAAFFGVPAGSGRKVSVTGMSIYRIANGQIVEHWGEMDFSRVLMQLGALPAPGL